MAPHSSILAWKVPWTEDPGGLQSMGSQRVGHDWAYAHTHTHTHTRTHAHTHPDTESERTLGAGSLDVGQRYSDVIL